MTNNLTPSRESTSIFDCYFKDVKALIPPWFKRPFFSIEYQINASGEASAIHRDQEAFVRRLIERNGLQVNNVSFPAYVNRKPVNGINWEVWRITGTARSKLDAVIHAIRIQRRGWTKA